MKGSVHRVKPLALWLAVAALAGCAGQAAVEPARPAPDPAGKGCYQADWQAETAPLLNKRLGPDGLEKYDTPSPAREQGCP
ncbi:MULTISPECIES: hypothetical protein [Pseudomonas]|uniref:hypothetical protein n=1 Tax=Pseudomonas TaxID=286 RepID=UPI0006B5A0FF